MKSVGGTDTDKVEIDRLQSENAELKSKIAAMEEKNAAMEAKLAGLEKVSGGGDTETPAPVISSMEESADDIAPTTQAPAEDVVTPETPTVEPETPTESTEKQADTAPVSEAGENKADASTEEPMDAEPAGGEEAPAPDPVAAADPPSEPVASSDAVAAPAVAE